MSAITTKDGTRSRFSQMLYVLISVLLVAACGNLAASPPARDYVATGGRPGIR